MGDVLESLTEDHIAWAMKQKIFFASTAPLCESGHVNCSPKASGCYQFPDNESFIYSDFTGSANETIAHVNENGRILIMFCSFEGPPRIMRLHNLGLRSFIKVTINRASVSCGYSVPLFEFAGHRDALDKWANVQGEEKLQEYRAKKNSTSIDGLPGYELLRRKK